jgi:hypothetical protein
MALRSSDGVVTTTVQKRASVQVSYDASTRSYTVATDGRSQTFSPADAVSTNIPGETRYRKKAASSDTLTLVTSPYYGATASNNYVGLGYWQHDDVDGGIQSTQFSTFTYGLATGAGAVPRTGTARWKTDIFGLLTTPGVQIRTIQGSGSFDVDFGAGVFTAFANVNEFDYTTGGGRVGSLRFRAGGDLGSGSSFSGNFSYATSSFPRLAARFQANSTGRGPRRSVRPSTRPGARQSSPEH